MARTTEKPEGNGQGLWGPAKGAGSGPAKPFGADSPTRKTIPGGVGDPIKKLTREEKASRDEDRAEQYRQIIHDIAIDPKTPKALKLYAVERGLDRIEGKPPQKTQLTGPDDGPVKVETIRRVIVDPRDPNT